MRTRVPRTDRLAVTAQLIRSVRPSSVLEVGAGDYSFKDHVPGVRTWHTVDFRPPADTVADLNRPDLSLPFHPGQFDLIVCTEVLEHLLWPQALLADARRILAPAGRVVVSVPNMVSLTYRIAWLLGRLPSCAASGNLPASMQQTGYQSEDSLPVGGHVIDFPLARLEGLSKVTGFEIAARRGSGLIWHRQIMPAWVGPVSLASNLVLMLAPAAA